ncbi:MAG: hypothetical protein ACYS76_04450 [Planctomycetota bacterium]|jgi:hypothetical protein
MDWWELIVNVGLVVTALNVVLIVGSYLIFGKESIYRAILWLYIKARGPLHNGATCAIYPLEPMGPWVGVCEICKFIDACEVMAWGPDGEDIEVKK